MHPTDQTSALELYPFFPSLTISGGRYPFVPRAELVVCRAFEVPSEVRPKSVIFQTSSLRLYRTTKQVSSTPDRFHTISRLDIPVNFSMFMDKRQTAGDLDHDIPHQGNLYWR